MNKKLANLYYLAAAGFFVVFIIRMLDNGFSGNIVWLCLASANLCLGAAALRRNKNNDNDDDKESDE